MRARAGSPIAAAILDDRVVRAVLDIHTLMVDEVWLRRQAVYLP